MQPKTKRLLVNEQQLKKIFEHKMLTALERHYKPDQPMPSVNVKKDELVKMMHDVNYQGIICTGTANEPTPSKRKIIQINTEQLNRLVAKLLTIENTVEDGGYVEGFKMGTIFYGDKYHEMPSFGVIASPE